MDAITNFVGIKCDFLKKNSASIEYYRFPGFQSVGNTVLEMSKKCLLSKKHIHDEDEKSGSEEREE